MSQRQQDLSVSTTKNEVEVLKIHDDSDPETEDAAAAAADPVVDTPKKLKKRPARSMFMRPSTAAPSTIREPLFIR